MTLRTQSARRTACRLRISAHLVRTLVVSSASAYALWPSVDAVAAVQVARWPAQSSSQSSAQSSAQSQPPRRAAPRSSKAPSQPRPAAPDVVVDGARRIVDRHWVSFWAAGGSDDDELFGAPRDMLADAHGVYVLDPGTFELLAFSFLGKPRWRAGSRGEGPGQLRRPIDLTLAPNGDIAVLDPDNARVSFFRVDGHYAHAVTSPSAVAATSLCINRASQLYLHQNGATAFVDIIDVKGKRAGAVRFPFAAPRDAPAFARSAFFARGVPTTTCAFATLFGYGIGIYAPASPPRITPFIERVANPTFSVERAPGGRVRTELVSGANAASGALRVGDSILVPFAGSTKYAHTIGDLYDGRGRYVESWTLPCPLPAYHPPWLYCLFNVQETPRLMGFVARDDTLAVVRTLRPGARGTTRK